MVVSSSPLLALACGCAVGGSAALVLLSLATLVVAAKTHGRQVRLERERAGYTRVVFGGANPAFVTALWRRDRVRVWGVAGAVVVVVAALAWDGRWPLAGGLGLAWGLLFAPMLGGFVVAGLLSALGFLAGAADDPAFTRASLPGSLRWWSLLAGLVAATLIAARGAV